MRSLPPDTKVTKIGGMEDFAGLEDNENPDIGSLLGSLSKLTTYESSVNSDRIEFYAREENDGIDVNFSVNGDLSRDEGMSSRRGASIAYRVKSIMQYDVSTRPEGTIYKTSAWTGDNAGTDRTKAYERFGFSPPDNGKPGGMQWAIVQNGKLTPYNKDGN